MASKTQQLKNACGYSATPVLPVCGTCKHMRSDIVVIPWVLKELQEKGKVHVYTVGDFTREEDIPDSLRKESNIRCSLHGFAVKKMGACKTWEIREEATGAGTPT